MKLWVQVAMLEPDYNIIHQVPDNTNDLSDANATENMTYNLPHNLNEHSPPFFIL